MLDLEIIRDSILFKNIDDIDFDIICAETKPSAKFFSAGEPVQLQGDKVEKIGIIVEGRILSFKYHYDGSSQLLRTFHQNDIIGLEAVSSTFFTSPSMLTADTGCAVVFFRYSLFFSSHGISPSCKIILLQNITKILSDENIKITYKVDVLSKHTIRERILTHLSIISEKRGSHTFDIGMNQEQFAQYLCVNRSTLSRELNAMRREGLIRFSRTTYTLCSAGQRIHRYLSGKTVPVINPANGKIIGEAASSDSRDVEKAIHAARSSFYGSGKWRRLCAQDRADALLKIASMMEAERDELAAIETENHGKPLRESEADIDDAIHVFKYYAGLIMKPSGGSYEVNDNFGHMHSYTVHEPVGVCALITPWNYPLMIAVWKLAPALAAGNSIILKPATITPASVVKLFEILDRAGLPDGCANLILGPGGLIGNQLAKSKDVDCITFTGSTAVGQSIMCAASSNVKKIGLELGGKSPSIIFADADINRAVEWSMIGIFMNQGEICSAGSRIIVHESIHDEFTDRLVE